MTRGLGLDVFHCLCEAGTALEVLRGAVPPGSDAWTALTELLLQVERCLAMLVESPALEEEETHG